MYAYSATCRNLSSSIKYTLYRHQIKLIEFELTVDKFLVKHVTPDGFQTNKQKCVCMRVCECACGGCHGLMVRELDSKSKGCEFESRAGRNCRGVNVQHSLHPQYHDWGALEQGTEPLNAPLALQHKWLHLEWVKCRAWILSMGHHTWPYVTLLPV